mgnify:CR=1 FL=1
MKYGYDKTVEAGKKADAKMTELGVYKKAGNALSAGAAWLGNAITKVAQKASEPAQPQASKPVANPYQAIQAQSNAALASQEPAQPKKQK